MRHIPSSTTRIGVLAVLGAAGLCGEGRAWAGPTETPGATARTAVPPKPSESGSSAGAQDASPPEPQRETSALAGPKVRAVDLGASNGSGMEGMDGGMAGGGTLVELDSEGRVKGLDVPPEEAALKLLSLDDAARAAVEKVILERVKILDRVCYQNLDVLVRIGNASGAGDKVGTLSEAMVLLHRMDPVREWGNLEEKLRAVLPDGARERHAALVNEYWNALVKDRQEAARRSGEDVPPRFAVIMQANAEITFKEIERSIERTVGQGEREFEEFLEKLGVTPEQEGKIRGLVATAVEKNGLKEMSKEQQQRLFVSIFAWLNAEQQQKALEMVAEEEAMKK